MPLQLIFKAAKRLFLVRKYRHCCKGKLFNPWHIQACKYFRKLYVDGGVVSPVAVDAAKRLGADIVIAVDMAGDVDSSQPEGTIETILQSITIMYSKLAAIQLSKADVVIKPKVGYISSGDFSKRHEAVLEGEKAALEALPKIQEIVNKLKQEGGLN